MNQKIKDLIDCREFIETQLDIAGLNKLITMTIGFDPKMKYSLLPKKGTQDAELKLESTAIIPTSCETFPGTRKECKLTSLESFVSAAPAEWYKAGVTLDVCCKDRDGNEYHDPVGYFTFKKGQWQIEPYPVWED